MTKEELKQIRDSDCIAVMTRGEATALVKVVTLYFIRGLPGELQRMAVESVLSMSNEDIIEHFKRQKALFAMGAPNSEGEQALCNACIKLTQATSTHYATDPTISG